MDDEQGPYVDMRSFRWRAEPLLRKLQVQRDVGRQLFAGARREAKALRLSAEQQDAAKQRAVAWAPAAAAAGTLDPAALARALAHVTCLVARANEARAAAQDGQHRADLARAAWLEVEGRISCVRKIRQSAAADYAAMQRRRADKEADQLWLAQGRGT